MNALRFMFGVLLVGGAGFVLATSGALPEHVASHFDGRGQPNGWMTREGYRLFMLFFACGLPLVVVGVVSWLPRRYPRLTHVPHREFWLSQGEREHTFAYLSRHALVLGCVLVVFASAVHWLVVMANRLTPPRLDNAPLFAMLAAFVFALTIWAGMLYWRFRRRP